MLEERVTGIVRRRGVLDGDEAAARQRLGTRRAGNREGGERERGVVVAKCKRDEACAIIAQPRDARPAVTQPGGERLHRFLEEIAGALPGAGEKRQRLLPALHLGDIGNEDDDSAVARRLLKHAKPGVVTPLALERAVAREVILHALAQPRLLVADGGWEHAERDGLAQQILKRNARHEKLGARSVDRAVTLVAQHQPIFGVEDGNAFGQTFDRAKQARRRRRRLFFGQALRGHVGASPAIAAKRALAVEDRPTADLGIAGRLAVDDTAIDEVVERAAFGEMT